MLEESINAYKQSFDALNRSHAKLRHNKMIIKVCNDASN